MCGWVDGWVRGWACKRGSRTLFTHVPQEQAQQDCLEEGLVTLFRSTASKHGVSLELESCDTQLKRGAHFRVNRTFLAGPTSPHSPPCCPHQTGRIILRSMCVWVFLLGQKMWGRNVRNSSSPALFRFANGLPHLDLQNLCSLGK